MNAFFIYVFPWIFVAAGTLALGIGSRNLRRGYRSLHWPCVTGIITSSYTTEHPTGEEERASIPTISYNYSVDGTAYSGTRIALGDNTSYARGYAQEVCSRYPIGREVRVYYDPSDSASSVLVPGPSHAAWFAFVVGVVFVVVGLAVTQFMSFFPPQ